MRNSLIFGGINSADYGVFLTGSGTFSAPERAVELIPVEGRNGDLVIDGGRWNNIEVEYPANIPSGFDGKMSAFRAAICRKIGYQRLEDTYHPDEYRVGVLTMGIQPEMSPLNRGGDFTLTFNCKPQRFLKSGDIPLQFLPWTPTTYRTQYIPATVGDRPTFTAHCPEGDTLEFRLTAYDSNYTETSHIDGTLTNGQEFYFTVLSGSVYWRFELTGGVTNPNETYIEIFAHTTHDGEDVTLNAMLAGHWTYHNPTGYAAKPLIKCYGAQLPYITWTNYVDGAEDFYYDFHTTDTGATKFWMDCDMQYLYDADKNNLTKYLYLTTTGTEAGEGMIFPELGEEEIDFSMYFPTSDPANGLGLIELTPRWWRI